MEVGEEPWEPGGAPNLTLGVQEKPCRLGWEEGRRRQAAVLIFCISLIRLTDAQMGLPSGSVSKNIHLQCGRLPSNAGDLDSIAGSGISLEKKMGEHHPPPQGTQMEQKSRGRLGSLSLCLS